jgi:hypothetical protein
MGKLQLLYSKRHVTFNTCSSTVELTLTTKSKVSKVEELLTVRSQCRHTYHSRFIPEGVAEASQIFLRDPHVVVILYDVHGEKGEVQFFYFVPYTTRDINYRQGYIRQG